MKIVKAVQPYIHPGHLNFKLTPYEAWVENGGDALKPHYPWRALHGAAYRMELPRLWTDSKVAALMFVEPVSITFDTFPYYATHEIIPFIWDCWPCYYDKMERWMKKHKVRTAIFTSSQEMAEMQRRCPDVRMMHCPEAVDSSLYKEGKVLKDRSIDLLEFGRSNEKVVSFSNIDSANGIDVISAESGKSVFRKFNHVCTKVGNKFLFTNDELYTAMGEAKITICLPKSMTHPQIAEGVETLTQRYWEAMLSRMVIVGHCPRELEELIGYNPVVELSSNDDDNDTAKAYDNEKLILDVIEHIEDYQELVDRNREVALRMGDWELRMKDVMEWLESLGYKCKED